LVSTGTDDSALQTSTSKPSTAEFVSAAVASEATTATVLEVLATTSALTDSAVSLVSALSKMAPASTGIVCTIIERGSGSAPTELAQPWTSWKNWHIIWYNNSSPP